MPRPLDGSPKRLSTQNPGIGGVALHIGIFAVYRETVTEDNMKAGLGSHNNVQLALLSCAPMAQIVTKELPGSGYEQEVYEAADFTAHTRRKYQGRVPIVPH